MDVFKNIKYGDVEVKQPVGLFINNEFVASKAGNTLSTVNPTTEEEITSVFAAESEDVDVAVAAARKAYASWKKVPGNERGALLRKLADLCVKHYDTLTAIEATDSGKPRYNNANYDVDECINVYNYFGGWADKVHGKVMMDDQANKLMYTRHQPYGVCGQIIPWNYPLAMASWKIGPAIAAGNVIVLKTAEQTPLSMLYFGNLVKEAGFPPGVINIISGYGRTAGAALASHMDVDKIAFTGSTATGKLIMEMAAKSNLKAVTLECGGKSPMVVFDDCDFEQAVKWAVFGIMYNQGQVCCATSRLIVQDTIYDKFVEALKKEVESQTVIGDPFNKDVGHGPQVSEVQHKRVLSYIEKGKQEGARLVTGGVATTHNNKGYYIKPTVFADCTQDMTIVKEEIFGPVVVVGKFSTEEEALEKANDTSYGLGAAVFTQNITRAHEFANEIDAGTVWINSSNDSDIHLPFGGFKMSGVGTELGEYGLNTYTQVKSIQLNLGSRL